MIAPDAGLHQRADIDAGVRDQRHARGAKRLFPAALADFVQRRPAAIDEDVDERARAVEERHEASELLDRKMRRAERDGAERRALVQVGERARRFAQIFRRQLQVKVRREAPASRLEIRRFGRDAHDMKQRHRAGRGGGRAQRLQIILAHVRGQADNRRNKAAATASDRMADRDCELLIVPIFRDRNDLDQSPSKSVFRQVQPICGRAAGHGAAEVDEIAIAIGARADHRIGEGDGVRFSPGDLRAEARAIGGLIGRAGEGRRAAELDMRAHEPGAVLRMLLRAAKEFGMNEIDRADIEGCRHANLAAEFDHPFGEVEAGAPMIETAVDMRRLDVDEGARVDRFGEAHKEPHGEGRAAAMHAAQEFAIERGEIESHWRRRYG